MFIMMMKLCRFLTCVVVMACQTHTAMWFSYKVTSCTCFKQHKCVYPQHPHAFYTHTTQHKCVYPPHPHAFYMRFPHCNNTPQAPSG